MNIPTLHMHAEEVVQSLVRIRRKQLQMAAAVLAARNASPDEEAVEDEHNAGGDMQELAT
jgi:hypothetical protein